MRRTNLSLIYVATYLVGTGIFFVAVPRLALKLLLSTGAYGEIFPRVAGLLFLGLGIIVVQIIRLRVEFLYPTTLAVRAVFFVGFVWLYLMSRDPLFLVLLAVLGVGMVGFSVSYVLDKRDIAHRPSVASHPTTLRGIHRGV